MPAIPLPARWQCDMCGTIWSTKQLAEECSAECYARAKGYDNVSRWDEHCAVIDDTFALPGGDATELLADYICDYLEEDDRDTGPSDLSVGIARHVAIGLIPIGEVIRAVQGLRS